MSNAVDAGAFISDPLDVARKLYSLAQTERRLAHSYLSWAREARTTDERLKWEKESHRCWGTAFFALRKYREYVESAIG